MELPTVIQRAFSLFLPTLRNNDSVSGVEVDDINTLLLSGVLNMKTTQQDIDEQLARQQELLKNYRHYRKDLR